jgi:hypothetical protein
MSGVPWKAWVEQRRRPVIIGAFVAAALLGILIGLLTAPSGDGGTAAANGDVWSPQRAPAVPALPDARAAGSAVNLNVPTELRPALQWATADAALAAAGKTTLSAAYLAASASPSAAAGSLNAVSGAGTGAALTADAISIPVRHLYYGVVEGATAADDVYWAAGNTQTTSTAVPVPGLEVWKRSGNGPWSVFATGAGACQKVPSTLLGTAWSGGGGVCDAAG